MRLTDKSSPLTPQVIPRLLSGIGRPFLQLLLTVIYAVLVLFSALISVAIYSIKLAVPRVSMFLSLLRSRALLTRSIATQWQGTVSTRISRLVNNLPHTSLSRRVQTPWLMLTAGMLLAGFLLLSTTYLMSVVRDLPDPEKLTTRDQIVSTKIYDRNGNLLYKIYNKQNRTPVQLKDIPEHTVQATIAIEDRDFYTHAGFSFRGILRALRHTLLEGRLEGGSTITQQLVKNALLTREQTLERKLKELMLSVVVELRYTKEEILSMYFNEVAYGGSAYGIEEAAQTFFAKPASQLTLAEGALLAGLPAAPTRFSPFGAHPELAKFRQHEVLRRMVEEGYLTQEEAEATKRSALFFAQQKTDIKAPHFVMYIKELLVERFGEQMVQQGGLKVITSLDLQVQTLAQQAVRDEVERLERSHITNGAALVTLPQTGEILAMVGSRDYFDVAHDGQVNVTLRPRQPGSAIKPVNYAVALENGMTAATMLSDTPVTYHLPGQPPYAPTNYDGNFHGRISLRSALANSYNVPAVKTLAVFGVAKMLEKGHQMGITTWTDPSRFGLSLTLGGGEVKMMDLATVYGVLANTGRRVNPAPILEVSDYRGRLLYQYRCDLPTDKTLVNGSVSGEETCTGTEVVKPEIAFILTTILMDNEARTPAFGRYSALNIPGYEVAVKTGTTQNLRDNWTIGYSRDILVATWVGNNDNSPMSYVASGLTGASSIWNRIMSTLLAEKPARNFTPPQMIRKVMICPQTGTLSCESCPGRGEYFIAGTEPTSACIPQVAHDKTQEEETVEELRRQASKRIGRISFDRLLKEKRPR